MSTELALLVFGPLVAALLAVLAPRTLTAPAAVAALVAIPVALVPLTATVAREGVVTLALGGFAPPLGLLWRADALAVVMLWMVAAVAALGGLHAATRYRVTGSEGRRFWSLWLLLVAGLNAGFLAGDLFNLFVTVELVTLCSTALVALAGSAPALLAAMRYLLLGLAASLLYLLGTGLVYAQAGTLDLVAAADGLSTGPLAAVALAPLVVGLLLKSAIVPLHVWLPAAHGNAPGPVSAILSAVVVKVTLVALLRVGFWTAPEVLTSSAALLLGLLGAAAILYGSLAALVQPRLKMVVAYSTVAQLGYVLLLFPLASAGAFHGVAVHLVAHAFAKAALFLAAANVLHAVGSDRLSRLVGLDRKLPVDVIAFAFAGASIMGLPPTGGFVAKWLLVEAAWAEGGWFWILVITAGSLLAAGYVFRVVALTSLGLARTAHVRLERPPGPASYVALTFALLAIALGFAGDTLVTFLSGALPPSVRP
jgi:multicomponent Na+:H+ antiporter subunit D